MPSRLRLEGVTFFNYLNASFVLSQNSDNWNRILNVLLCAENVRTTALLMIQNAYAKCLDKGQSKFATQTQCLEHFDAEQGMQKILLLTPAAGNMWQLRNGGEVQRLNIFSLMNFWFLN